MKKKSKIILCGIMTLIMAFVMAMPVSTSAASNLVDTGEELVDAINASGNDDTITLGADIEQSIIIPEGKTITLDLNGYTLTGIGEKSKATIVNNGNLTIKDSATGGKITRDSSTNDYYVVDNQGIMIIESGEVSVKSFAGPSSGSSLIRNAGDGREATLNINGGVIHQDGFIAIKNDDLGILNVTGGKISTSGDTDVCTLAAIQNWGTANISGGEIGNLWISAWSDNFTVNTTIDGDVDISGKIIIKKNDGYEGTQKPGLEIKDGNFDVVWSVVKDDVNVGISGGTYTEAPDMDFVQDGNVAVGYKHSGETLYYIGTADEIKNIVENAQNGDEIEILKGDIDLQIEGGNVKITNNGNGKVTANGVELKGGYGITTENPEQGTTDPSEQETTGTEASGNSAKTGDDFNMAAVVAIMGIAAAAAAGTIVYGRRKRHN